MNRLKEIDLEINEIHKIIEEKDKIWDNSKPWDEYKEFLKPENKKISKLSREKRMIMPYTLSSLPTYGDVMSLEDFIENVEYGGFIDYDGSGNYVKDGMETDIPIYPSDVEHKSIRKEFDTIIWFNR